MAGEFPYPRGEESKAVDDIEKFLKGLKFRKASKDIERVEEGRLYRKEKGFRQYEVVGNQDNEVFGYWSYSIRNHI